MDDVALKESRVSRVNAGFIEVFNFLFNDDDGRDLGAAPQRAGGFATAASTADRSVMVESEEQSVAIAVTVFSHLN